MGIELVEGRDLVVHDNYGLHADDFRAAARGRQYTAAWTTIFVDPLAFAPILRWG